jgi:TrmH family RNA methyltransferase
MLSKARIKFIKSLQLKKYRKQEQCFVVEGAKSVQELLSSRFEVMTLVATAEFLRDHVPAVEHAGEVIEVSERELEGLGEYNTNQAALAVARMPQNTLFVPGPDEYALVLDAIQDPGNLGTILRTADWFGIRGIIASADTADFYNGKVIQASMGSFTRVQVYYTDLTEYLSSFQGPVLGAFLGGEDVHQFRFPSGGLMVIGNEGKGISPAVEKHITHRITIPRYGQAESLNAAMATAIICDNLRRPR